MAVCKILLASICALAISACGGAGTSGGSGTQTVSVSMTVATSSGTGNVTVHADGTADSAMTVSEVGDVREAMRAAFSG